MDDKYRTPVDLKIRDGRGEYPNAGYIGSEDKLRQWRFDGGNCTYGNLMNAREVPVAREFWVNEYRGGGRSVYPIREEALKYRHVDCEIIHVREVLPGEGE